MEILFTVCLVCIIYSYFGYPLLLILMTLGKKENESDVTGDLPSVSFIISAHNEETIIEKKLLNTFEIDYPGDRFEVIVVSDGSSDNTPSIVRRYSDRDVTLVELPEHVGKTAAQNEAIRHATGSIIVFSDANGMFEKQAVRTLVGKFFRDSVGCVCGELRYRNSDASSIGKSENTYWEYEQFCKKHESLLGSLLGVNGAIYAVRRECFVELPPDIISDFILPMMIYENGWEIRYCSEAVAVEDASKSFGDEFRRKKRIIVRSLHGLFRNSRFLNPFCKGFFSIEIWSHKLIRWFVPVLLAGMVVTSGLLFDHMVFRYIFAIQIVFYCMAVAGAAGGERARSFSFIYIPYYFSVINLAALMAIVEFIMGERYKTWSTVRS
ncbi:glycosyltransferase family 2 protein [bacterium]|nr:glycosyltransferase family 2 protein [bacterium]